MQPGSSLDEKIPVFVFPNSLDFYSADKSHKRLLTVYNPYEFGVRFKVLCTAPEKYEVSSPEGKIKPKCQIDLVVRHKVPTPANSNISDKIRVQMLHRETKQVIGKKDIVLTLHSGEPPREDEDRSSEFSADRATEWKRSTLANFDTYPQDRKGAVKTSPHPLIWLTGIICFVCLLFPNEGESSSLSFTVPFNVKLIFSYILGLVTMVVFRA
ncbi:Hypothetical protein NTJ_05512 [Nesidiocoris tenuis]|uniref:MSP domain-containing protein n=1 Tax=Nesidiocoris tenuis TaxID=355587 RepID=A0ABN7AKX4_9HEMI|nr:Hypothetical protein NTJ_05512 [Nesidiocoris tenuis]